MDTELYLSYIIIPEERVEQNKFVADMRVLEEEDPKLHISVEQGLRWC